MRRVNPQQSVVHSHLVNMPLMLITHTVPNSSSRDLCRSENGGWIICCVYTAEVSWFYNYNFNHSLYTWLYCVHERMYAVIIRITFASLATPHPTSAPAGFRI